MAAGAKKGGPERGEKELKKEKMGRRVPYGEWVRVGETYGGLEKGRGSGGGVYIGGGWESVRNNDPFFFFFFQLETDKFRTLLRIYSMLEDVSNYLICHVDYVKSTVRLWKTCCIQRSSPVAVVIILLFESILIFQFLLFAHVLCMMCHTTLRKLNMQNRW